MNSQLPGMATGSILRLPNIGAEPKAEWRFDQTDDGARADWALQLRSVLEAFLEQAVVTATPVKKPDEGWAVTYRSPTSSIRRENLTERTVTLTWMSSTMYKEDKAGSCISAEWIRQRDDMLAPNGVYDYKVLTALQRGGGDGNTASGFLRVAAFLQPSDDYYIEAKGEAAAVYDYSISLKRKVALEPA